MKTTIFPQNDTDLNGLIRNTKVSVNIDMLDRSDASSDPSTLFDNTETYEVCTGNIPDAYFIFSFPKHFIILTNYTFSTNIVWDDYKNFPVSWKVEGAYHANGEWHQIGYVQDSNLLNEKIKTFSIDIPNHVPNFFTKIKFQMIGKSSNQVKYYFCLHKMDFFGTLISERAFFSYIQKVLFLTPNSCKSINFNAFIYVFISYHS